MSAQHESFHLHMSQREVAYAIIGLFPVFAIAYAVLAQSKYVASLAQLGSVFEREQETEEHRMNHAKRAVKSADRAYYVLGVLNVAFTAYLLGAAPQHFYLWHTPKAIILITLRWWTFMKEGKHWLLTDFCYVANVIGLLYLWVFPSNALLFQVFFLVSNGPVAWSVLTFSHSLIFHSHAHMTSVFTHVSPLLVTWTLRWSQPAQFKLCDDPTCAQPPIQLWWDATRFFYIPWIVSYYILIFLLLGSHLKRNSYQTLFDRVTTSGSTAKVLTKVFRSLGISAPLAQRAVYLMLHLLFGMVTMAIAVLHWYSMVAHTAFLVTVCTATVYNAATYYFSVFAQRYEAGVDNIVEKARQNRKAR